MVLGQHFNNISRYFGNIWTIFELTVIDGVFHVRKSPASLEVPRLLGVQVVKYLKELIVTLTMRWQSVTRNLYWVVWLCSVMDGNYVGGFCNH